MTASTLAGEVTDSNGFISSDVPFSAEILSPASDVVSIAADEIAALGDDPLRLTVVLRVHRRGASRTVNQIVTALGNLGVSKVRIAVVTDQS